MNRVMPLMARVLAAYRETLGDDLCGLYLHGSYALGGFRWDGSDLDFLVVALREPDLNQKRVLIQTLLDLWPDAPPRGFEMSVVLRKDLNPFVYPTPFCLHLSSMHEARARADILAYCESMRGDDPDLAAHAAVVRQCGVTVYGVDPREVIGDVPGEAFLDSVLCDIRDARADMADNPMYVTLTLCRVLGWLRTGLILSKSQGGAWGCEAMPESASLIREALDACERGADMPNRAPERAAFCERMMNEIERAISANHTLHKR